MNSLSRTHSRRTALGCATKVRRTAECYPSTSKRIRLQYVYVGSILCLGKCLASRPHTSFAFGRKPDLELLATNLETWNLESRHYPLLDYGMLCKSVNLALIEGETFAPWLKILLTTVGCERLRSHHWRKLPGLRENGRVGGRKSEFLKYLFYTTIVAPWLKTPGLNLNGRIAGTNQRMCDSD